MRIERVALVAVTTAGCSLFVSFNDNQVPFDAPPDAFAPIPAAQCMFGGSNDTPQTAFPITPADTGPAAICPNADGTVTQLNYYSFTVPADVTAVALGISCDPTRANGNLDMILYDAAGSSMIGESVGFGTTQMLVCPGVSPPCPALVGSAGSASYLIEVLPGIPGNFNSYTFSLAFTAGSGSGSGSG